MEQSQNAVSTTKPQRVLRRQEVLDIRGDTTATLYADMAEGRFPRPIRTGKRSVAWLESEVLAWQQARIAERNARLVAEAKAKAKADAVANEVLGGCEDEPEPEAAQMIFTDFPRGRYGAILVDPPWHFRTRSDKGRDRCADKHYPTMSLNDIKALPVTACAAKDCALFLWVPDPMLPAALDVSGAWGFEFKVVFTWAKTTKSGDFHIGCGYWTRANPEMCLLATRGRPDRLAKDVRQLIVTPRREHSRKPDEAYERIERLVRGPYLELFARGCRPGWDAWGNEAGKQNSAERT